MQEKIETLQSMLSDLKTYDAQFASNLIASYHKYGKLTAKQAPWIDTLIQRAMDQKSKPAYEPVKVNVGEFLKVVELFDKAKEHLKYPKITLSCMGKKVLLSVAGSGSKVPGSISVMGEGKYPAREWFGRVSQLGTWTPSPKVLENSLFMTELKALLEDFGNDPAGVAKKYGLLTGNCCFCGSDLSDERSTAAGFGPVCADHYGLKAQWKLAVKLAEEKDCKLGGSWTPEKEVAAQQAKIDFSGSLCYLCNERPGAVAKEGYIICSECNDEMEKAV